MRAELYEIARGAPGTLSVMARPRGGVWLPDEVHAWQDARVDVIVSLLTHDEQQELELLDEAALCQHCGLIYFSYPIPDRGIPSSSGNVKPFIDSLARHVNAGRHVAIHCRMGIGRSAMIAAATLVMLGETVERAFAMIRVARGYDVPDTLEQRVWVERFSVQIQRPTQE